MKIESAGLAVTMPHKGREQAADQAEGDRKDKESLTQVSLDDSGQGKVQPEEILDQIKKLTEDGLYSVRFENDDATRDLVVKIVDKETDEVIRQVPAEEILDLAERLQDLRGNIVNTVG